MKKKKKPALAPIEFFQRWAYSCVFTKTQIFFCLRRRILPSPLEKKSCNCPCKRNGHSICTFVHFLLRLFSQLLFHKKTYKKKCLLMNWASYLYVCVGSGGDGTSAGGGRSGIHRQSGQLRHTDPTIDITPLSSSHSLDDPFPSSQLDNYLFFI